MRLSEIGHKEIVDLSKGARYGELWDAEMLFEKPTGQIKAILVPSFQKTGAFKNTHDWLHLPWVNVVKIGEDMIIFKSE